MNRPLLRMMMPLSVALAMAGCGESTAPDRAAGASQPAERPVPERIADTAGNDIAYTCADGTTIRIGNDALNATVALQNGRNVTLPRAESASKADGDVYVGEALSVLREGRTAQLHKEEGSAVACSAP